MFDIIFDVRQGDFMNMLKGIGKLMLCSVLLGTCIISNNIEVSAKNNNKYDDVAKWATKCSSIIENDKVRNECSEYKNYLESHKDSKIKMTSLKKDLSNLKDVTMEYQETIDKIVDDVISVDESIKKMDKNIEKLNDNIKDTKEKIKERKKIVLKRMASMQSTVNTNQFATYIMGAEDLIDMIQRSKVVEQLTANDKEQIDLLNKELDKLKIQKAEVSRMQETLKIQKDVLDSKKSQLKQIKKENDKIIKDHKKEIEKIYEEEAKKAEESSTSLTDAATISRVKDNINRVNKNNKEASNDSKSNDSTMSAPSGKGSGSIVADARSYIGKAKYVFGATGQNNSYDCSSFVQHIYAMNGIKIPRTSFQQEHCLKAVPGGTKNAKAGDIIVFNGHVAIYSGHGTLIHALNPTQGICETKGFSCGCGPVIAVRRAY